MEVSVETTQGLERAMTVSVPAERVEKEVSSRLNKLKNTAKLNGFRPGKVPMAVVKKRFGNAVRYEVAEELIQDTFSEAINQEKLSPAGVPTITPEQIADGDGLKYKAVFEVYPEFEISPFDGLQIEKPVAALSEDDVDKMVENLRQQQKGWSAVERAAADGDQVNIDFKGTLDGEPFERGSAEGVPLVLGSGSMIEGFESGIIGMSADEEKTIDVTFPEGYSAPHLAGKEVQFEIRLNGVEEPQLPEIDEDFIEKYGVKEGGIEAFRAQIRENMQRECDQASTQLLKDQVMDSLYQAHDFSIPAALVENESKQMAENTHKQMGGEGAQLSAELFKDQAERRVKLGLVIAEIVSTHNIQVDPVRVQQQIEALAASYENPAEVVQWYNQNPEYMDGVRNLAMEEQIVDLVMKDAVVTDQEMAFEELMTKANANRTA